MEIFSPLPSETRCQLDSIPALIDKTFPLPGRFRSALPANVAELSRLLTSGRGERSLSYMGRPPLLSAYLRYFLPWNLYRLCRLLPSLDIPLAANDHITDLGCGPLTFVSALWLCRPDLRELPLEFRCIDRSGPALEAGKQFFFALAGEGSLWKIHTIKGGLDTARTKSASLVCAVNVCNEIYGDISHHDSTALRHCAEKIARLLDGYATAAASILVVEPGLPRCGEFISLLRVALMERNRFPVSPCPHNGDCPLPGAGSRTGKSRWCHFAFETTDAPQALHKLSALAGIPKERAVLSFLLTGTAVKNAAQFTAQQSAAQQSAAQCSTTQKIPLRIISDAFPLPQHRWGRYACSGQGLVLAAGENVKDAASGTLADAVFTTGERDQRSGALIAHIDTVPSIP
ncbi:MAG: rRNA methyltransferase [Treponema sp.]|jgi:hypothetical protein|nr:rRNA methyltransferase [Treponema sp.]